MQLTRVSIRCLELAMHPSRPMGLVTHWNMIILGAVKAE